MADTGRGLATESSTAAGIEELARVDWLGG
jgi:hypothetical protein